MKTTKEKLYVCILVLVVIAIIVKAYCFFHCKDQEGRIRAANRELSNFSHILQGWVIEHDDEAKKMPGPALKDAVTALSNDPLFRDRLQKECPMVVKNRDPWGHALVYQVSADGQTATITSLGSDGRFNVYKAYTGDFIYKQMHAGGEPAP